MRRPSLRTIAVSAFLAIGVSSLAVAVAVGLPVGAPVALAEGVPDPVGEALCVGVAVAVGEAEGAVLGALLKTSTSLTTLDLSGSSAYTARASCLAPVPLRAADDL
jgi:hypothetical protein